MEDDPLGFIEQAIAEDDVISIKNTATGDSCGARRNPTEIDLGAFVRNYGPGEYRMERRSRVDPKSPKGAILWACSPGLAREYGWADPDADPAPEPAPPRPAAAPAPYPAPYAPPQFTGPAPPGAPYPPPQYPPPWWGYPPQPQQPPAGDAMLAAAVTMMTKTLEQSAAMARAHTEAPKTPASESLSLLRELRTMMREEREGDDDDHDGPTDNPERAIWKPLAEAIADAIRPKRDDPKRAPQPTDLPATPSDAPALVAPGTARRLEILGEIVRAAAADQTDPRDCAAACRTVLGPDIDQFLALAGAPNFLDNLAESLPEVPRDYLAQIHRAIGPPAPHRQPAPPAPTPPPAASANGAAHRVHHRSDASAGG